MHGMGAHAICDRCGFKFYLSQLRTEWTGLKVCHDCYDPRHPQEAVRAVKDTQGVRPGMRPRPADVYVEYAFNNAEAQSLVSRFTAAPDTPRKILIDRLVGALKSAGVWSKLDALYVMAAHDAQAARRNWIADQYNLTAISSPTFTVDRGYAGDGASAYLTTGANPFVGLARFAQNSAHVTTYGNTAEATNSGGTIGAGASPTATLLYPKLGANFSGTLNSGSAVTVANSTTVGLFGINRSGASASELYANGSQVATGAPVSGGMTNNPIDILRRNPNYYTGRLAAASIGGSLSAQEHSDLYAALGSYLQAVGAA